MREDLERIAAHLEKMERDLAAAVSACRHARYYIDHVTDGSAYLHLRGVLDTVILSYQSREDNGRFKGY